MNNVSGAHSDDGKFPGRNRTVNEQDLYDHRSVARIRLG